MKDILESLFRRGLLTKNEKKTLIGMERKGQKQVARFLARYFTVRDGEVMLKESFGVSPIYFS